MKKLIIAASAVILGMTVSAATFNWSVMNDVFSPDGENVLEGTAYFFDASAYSMSTIASGLESTGVSALTGNLGSKVLSDGALVGFEGTGFDYDGTAPTSLTGFLIVISTDEKNYWTAGSQTVEVTSTIAGGAPAVFNFGEVYDATWTGSVAPEPTSGLLLLLGMASLALKRKRA